MPLRFLKPGGFAMLDLQPGTVVDDKYQILYELGQGGMGTVYAAFESELNRKVAIKFLHANLLMDDEHRARFEREGRVLATLSHTNILTFYRFGIWQKIHPFIVMELLEGQSLQSKLEKSGKLEFNQALDIAVQVCDALQAAHKHGIVHRDLKPGNVVLVDNPKPGHVKLVDFGLARVVVGVAVSQHLTQTGELVGSVYYMSPEQCLGRKADARSDIYSLGCIIYEALAGAPPLMADNPVGLMHKHATEPPVPLAPKLKDCVSQEMLAALEGVLHKAMAKSADARYQTAEAFKIDLQFLLQGESQNVSAKLVPSAKQRKIGSKQIIGALAGTILTLVALALWRQPHSLETTSPTSQRSSLVGSMHSRLLRVCQENSTPDKLEHFKQLMVVRPSERISAEDAEILYTGYMRELISHNDSGPAIEVGKQALTDVVLRSRRRAIAKIQGLMCQAYSKLERFAESASSGTSALRLFRLWPASSLDEAETVTALATVLVRTNKKIQALALLHETLDREGEGKNTSGIAAAIAAIDPAAEPKMFELSSRFVTAAKSEAELANVFTRWRSLAKTLPLKVQIERFDALLQLSKSISCRRTYCSDLCLSAKHLLASNEVRKPEEYLTRAKELLIDDHERYKHRRKLSGNAPLPLIFPQEDTTSCELYIYAGLCMLYFIADRPSGPELSNLCSLAAQQNALPELTAVARIAVDTEHFSQADRLFAAMNIASRSANEDPEALINSIHAIVTALPSDQQQRKVSYSERLCSILERARVPDYFIAVAQSKLAMALCKSGRTSEARVLIDSVVSRLNEVVNNSSQKRSLLLHIAKCYHSLGNDRAALRSLENALQTDPDILIRDALYQSAALCSTMHYEKKAIEYYERILRANCESSVPTAARPDLESSAFQIRTKVSLAELYNLTGQPGKAFQILKTVPSIPENMERTQDNVSAYITAYNSLSTYYANHADFKSARAMLRLSQKLAEDTGLSSAFQLALTADCMAAMPEYSESEKTARVSVLLDQAEQHITDKTPPTERHAVRLRRGLFLYNQGKVRESAILLNALVKDYAQECSDREFESARGYLAAAEANRAVGDLIRAERVGIEALERSVALFGRDSAAAREAETFLASLRSAKPYDGGLCKVDQAHCAGTTQMQNSQSTTGPLNAIRRR